MSIDERRLAKWYSHSEFFHLTSEQGANLLESVGYDYFHTQKEFEESIAKEEADYAEIQKNTHERAKQLLINIRYYLGIYPEAVKIIDNAPTQKDISEKFESLWRRSYELCEQLTKLGMHERAELELEDFKIHELQKDLACFLTVADKISSKKAPESRGKKKAITRKAIINHLAVEFDKYCIGECTEASKTEFISLALSYAGIPRPKNIKRLFYRPGEKTVYFKQIQ